jgi:hypothetical protein
MKNKGKITPRNDAGILRSKCILVKYFQDADGYHAIQKILDKTWNRKNSFLIGTE